MNRLRWAVVTSFMGFGMVSVGFAFPKGAEAQSITPAPDSTQTQVIQSSEQYDIGGGTTAGQNLFHSFETFGLSSGELANFIVQSDILNVLGRVTGGNPSIIDGLIQVSGASANLYLLNPAGILFGTDARLNLPAGFTATTADGIGIGDLLFDAVGSNDYAALISDPNALLFRTTSPGSVVNLGALSLSEGQNLVLAGGQVINTGTLVSAGGTIDIAAIPGAQWVRLSTTGSVLSYDISNEPTLTGITALDLPELLTGAGNLATLADLTVTETGAVQIGPVVLPTPDGTAIVSGQANVSNPDGVGGTLTLLGDTVGLLGGSLLATGQEGGGEIFVGGNYKGSGILPNAQVTYVAPESRLDVSATDFGNGGELIIWSDQTTRTYGQLLARGGGQGGNGGFIETSSQGYLDVDGVPDIGAASGDAGTWLIDPNNITIVAGANLNISQVGNVFTPTADGAQLNVALLDTALGTGGTVVVDTVGSVGTEAGDIVLATQLDYNLGATDATLRLRAAGSIEINQSIIPASAFASRLNIELLADAAGAGSGQGSVKVQGATTAINTNGGNFTVSANGSNIPEQGFFLESGTSIQTLGGNVTITGQGSTFPTGQGINIDSGASINSGFGNITLNGTSDNDTGVLINGTLSSTGGVITLTGNSTSLFGVHLDTPASITDGFNALNLNGTSSTNDGLRLEDDLVVGSTSGPISLAGTSATGRGILANGLLDSFGAALTISGNSNGAASVQVGGEIQGGAITINGVGGDILIDAIDGAGAINISTNQALRATGINFAGNSIETGGAPITITHGGNGAFPFVVGAASVNGTLGPITSTLNTITPTQSFLGDFILGNIQILTNVFVTPTVPTITPTVTPSNIAGCLTDCLPQIELGSPDVDISEGNANPVLSIAPELRGRTAATLSEIETDYVQDFTDYLGLEEDSFTKPELPKIQEDLTLVAEATGIKPAIVYVSFVPPTAEDLNPVEQARDKASDIHDLWPGETARQAQPNDLLELILITPGGPPIRKTISVTHAQVDRTANQLRSQVANRARINSRTYLNAAQQLYDWIVTPLTSELGGQDIGNLAFVMSPGLRSLPVSTLHDGEQFLIEQYSVGLVPSVSLTDLRYVDVRDTEVLAMGASNFVDQPELPAVPIELSTITERLWPGDFLINETFTPDLLISSRQQKPYGIVHLATHGEFKPGSVDNSYIQFWDQRLGLDQVRALGLSDPPVELMVLSACRTALGNEEAELGFAGLAVQSGVKTALASLWKVDDVGTAGLMTQFYTSLRAEPIKAEALRQAQLAMLEGNITVKDGVLTWSGGEIALPPELRDVSSDVFSHPYFWAAFTVIGSPW